MESQDQHTGLDVGRSDWDAIYAFLARPNRLPLLPDTLRRLQERANSDRRPHALSAIPAFTPNERRVLLSAQLLYHTRNNDTEGMAHCLNLGADINSDDYACWEKASDLVNTSAKFMLARWYARRDVINPDDPLCPTAAKIASEVAKVSWERFHDGNPGQGATVAYIEYGRDHFRAEMAKLSPAERIVAITEDTDCFGNNTLDILGERGKLDWIFDRKIWLEAATEMEEAWNHVAPLYKARFDIEELRADLALKNIKQRVGSRWKMTP